ncbi:YihY/virulence factor BrkB family protein [Geodermatophilus sp. DSM 44513]|uniref:YihY/virulence factor BrkB family protein n=1 Tax=Geodermatophilus sp. DSM 44513 TaxID=1528104 RepID=UPI0012861F7B|nr:YihY/virulence factor BrkB family protein [Geodermatophilus sp. DSM 44513]WNV73671.1 YihY/virulence factor BrkB family protein [Geodermatophilus sp. DSM 44513]
MRWTERLDRFQRRHPAAGFPIAVVYKYLDDDGHFLAALITYYGFLALFPTLLLLATVLGLLLAGDPQLQQQLLDSALGEFPVIGPQLARPEGLGGGATGIVVGGLVALYGATGLGQAMQHAMNNIWAVPRHSRPDPVTSRGRSLLLLFTLGLLLLASTVLSAVGTGVAAYGGSSTGWFQVLVIAASVAANAAVFVLGFRITTARRLTTRQVLPGALTAAVLWQLLQSFGGVYVARVVANASAVDAVFALVLGLIAFVYLAATALVLCVEIDAVRVDRLYPRALLTPFVDHTDLTEGDERVFTDAARAQRAVKHQEIDVRFGTGDDATPRP